MKVSIALATYNGEKYLAQQIESILSQTRLPDELVICDDYSTDKTVSIINNYTKKTSFDCVILCNEVNMGTGYSFKKAIDGCSGDIIVFCDQDDIWRKNKIERVEQEFKEKPNIHFTISNANIINEFSKDLNYTLWQQRKFTKFWKNRFNKINQFDVVMRKNIITGMTTAISQSLKKIGSDKKDNINHDAWYIYIASVMGLKGCLIDEVLIDYRQHQSQQFGSLKRSKLNNFINSLRVNNKAILLNIKNIENLIEFVGKNSVFIESRKKEYLHSKYSHLKTRLNINRSMKILRFWKILHEAVFNRYGRYSSNKNILIDFLSFSVKSK